MTFNDEDLKRRFSKTELSGRHFLTLKEDLNKRFLRDCCEQRRTTQDMLRIIIEDRYMTKEEILADHNKMGAKWTAKV